MSAALFALSLICLCTAGQMATFYVVAAIVALAPYGYDPRRPRRLIGLLLVLLNLTAAIADHRGGMELDRERYEHRQGLPTTTAAGRPGG